MLTIHLQAWTTPAAHAEIARSYESSGLLAKRYGVSTETIRKWRKRGPDACLDRSARPFKLAWRASDGEVLGITLYSHADLEVVLRGFIAAYNGRRQRVLSGFSLEMVLRQCRMLIPR